MIYKRADPNPTSKLKYVAGPFFVKTMYYMIYNVDK
jgi:hypothetical protein